MMCSNLASPQKIVYMSEKILLTCQTSKTAGIRQNKIINYSRKLYDTIQLNTLLNHTVHVHKVCENFANTSF